MSENVEPDIHVEVKRAVLCLSEQKEYLDPVIKYRNHTSLGDNYLGEVVNVIIVDSKNGKKPLDLIIKCAPTNESFRSKVIIDKIYERETYFYENVVNDLLKIQICNGIKEIFNPFAVCYKTISTYGIETLIMKNMKSIGYVMQDRTKPLDYNHIVLTMRSYGKLHALSFALKDQDPNRFKELASNLQEAFIDCFEAPPNYYQDVTRHLYEYLDGPLKKKFNNYRNKLESVLRKEMSQKLAGEYAVIGHGDSWTNNILYKYGDSESPEKPTDLIFLDWQLCKMCSPALDIFYFLFVCSDKAMRDKHYHHFMDEYYNSLASFVREMGSDPDRLFPREVFEQHLKRFMGYGVYMAATVLKLMLSDKEDIPDFKNMTVEELENIETHIKFIPGGYKERIIDVIADARKYGYVEFQ